MRRGRLRRIAADSLQNLAGVRFMCGYCRWGLPLMLHLCHDGVDRPIEHRRRFDKLNAAVF